MRVDAQHPKETGTGARIYMGIEGSQIANKMAGTSVYRTWTWLQNHGKGC